MHNTKQIIRFHAQCLTPTSQYKTKRLSAKSGQIYLEIRDKTQLISYLSMRDIALGQRTWEKQPGIGISVKFHHASIRTTADTQLNEYSHHQCWEAQTN